MNYLILYRKNCERKHRLFRITLKVGMERTGKSEQERRLMKMTGKTEISPQKEPNTPKPHLVFSSSDEWYAMSTTL